MDSVNIHHRSNRPQGLLPAQPTPESLYQGNKRVIHAETASCSDVLLNRTPDTLTTELQKIITALQSEINKEEYSREKLSVILKDNMSTMNDLCEDTYTANGLSLAQ